MKAKHLKAPRRSLLLLGTTSNKKCRYASSSKSLCVVIGSLLLTCNIIQLWPLLAVVLRTKSAVALAIRASRPLPGTRSHLKMAPRKKIARAHGILSRDDGPSSDTAGCGPTVSLPIPKVDDFLQAWLEHDSSSFHDISESEAVQIREKLSQWYRSNRRKLPWRGDPPPWEGSTANFAQKSMAKKKKQQQQTEIKQQQQTEITHFFNTNTTKAGMIDSQQIKVESTIAEEPCLQRTYPITAYGVWVSEIMCQQTRIEAVVAKWCRWMASFPTVQALACATPEQVNAHWAGLGFYRRARLLHSAAQRVVETRHGELPDSVEEWMMLPGVGRYTASAICSIAYNITVPVVDGNVCRVLSRLRGISNSIQAAPLKGNPGWDLAAQIVGTIDQTPNEPKLASASAGEINQALMELGATYCSPSGTGTDPMDPLIEFYWSTRIGQNIHAFAELGGSIQDLKLRHLGIQANAAQTCQLCADNGVSTALMHFDSLLTASDQPISVTTAQKFGHVVFPRAPPKIHKREDVLAVAVIEHEDSFLLVRRPDDAGLLAGQWEFPSAIVWSSTDENEMSSRKRKAGQRKDKSDQIPVVALAKRRKALFCVLRDLSTSTSLERLKFRSVSDGPLEHVFSHVRHTMWIDYALLDDRSCLIDVCSAESSDREARWMNASAMQNVGVTSGVTKIVKLIAEQRT